MKWMVRERPGIMRLREKIFLMSRKHCQNVKVIFRNKYYDSTLGTDSLVCI